MATIIRISQPRRRGIRPLRVVAVCALVAAICLLIMCHGCAPASTVALRDGFNAQWRGFSYLSGEPFGQAEAEITVKVVVVENMKDIGYPGAAGTYSHPQGVIRIVGKKVKGKLVLCPAVIGHEIMHALEYQDGRFANPDE